MKAQKRTEDADYTVKIVIVGDSGVGKTNILFRFCDNQFKTSYVATIGVDFKNKVIKVGDSKIKLQIWDTAGQQRFKNINQTYFKGALGVILAYSITDQSSFDNLQNWIKQIHQHSQTDVIKLLVGNKCDLNSQRKVETKSAERLAEKYQMDFEEVSAKDGKNINQLFQKLGERVNEYIKKTQNVGLQNQQSKRISLHNQKDVEKTEGGCKC